MSLPEVGDLAVVVHQCCDKVEVHPIGKVEEIVSLSSRCAFCRTSLTGQFAVFNDPEGLLYWPLSWLRRIPPLSSLEGLTDERDLPVTKEPA